MSQKKIYLQALPVHMLLHVSTFMPFWLLLVTPVISCTGTVIISKNLPTRLALVLQVAGFCLLFLLISYLYDIYQDNIEKLSLF